MGLFVGVEPHSLGQPTPAKATSLLWSLLDPLERKRKKMTALMSMGLPTPSKIESEGKSEQKSHSPSFSRGVGRPLGLFHIFGETIRIVYKIRLSLVDEFLTLVHTDESERKGENFHVCRLLFHLFDCSSVFFTFACCKWTLRSAAEYWNKNGLS